MGRGLSSSSWRCVGIPTSWLGPFSPTNRAWSEGFFLLKSAQICWSLQGDREGKKEHNPVCEDFEVGAWEEGSEPWGLAGLAQHCCPQQG